MNAPHRVVLSEMTTSLLRSLTAKTGLSANLLARFAMLISFEDSDPPANDLGKAGLTINRTSLFGEMEPFLISAFALVSQSSTAPASGRELASHIARGASHMNVRVSNITDLLVLVNDIS